MRARLKNLIFSSFLYSALAAVVILGFVSIIATTGDDKTGTGVRPVVFVHGYFGNAAQFESQAQRFIANGYPLEHLAVYEHDTGQGAPDPADQIDGLDTVIDAVRQKTGRNQVDLICHSRGAGLCAYYLEDSTERAEKVAHFCRLTANRSWG